MKKFLSVTLALIIALSVFSLNAFALDSGVADSILDIFETEKTKIATQAVVETDTDAGIETPDPEEPDADSSRALAWFENAKNIDELKLDMQLNSQGLDIVMYIKGDKAHAEISGYLNEDHYYDSETHYVIYSYLKFLCLDMNDGRNIVTLRDGLGELINTAAYSYSVSYEKDGYYVEEFEHNYSDNILSFYFDGENLVKFTEVDASGNTLVNAEVSYEVEDSDVNIPFFTIKSNLFLMIYLFFIFFFGLTI